MRTLAEEKRKEITGWHEVVAWMRTDHTPQQQANKIQRGRHGSQGNAGGQGNSNPTSNVSKQK
jgi:hypothetical protein